MTQNISTSDTVLRTDLPLPGKRQGKVRDIYEARTTDGQEALLIVQTDRISAFDVVMPNAIPQKGRVLTQIVHGG
jgi:phosphoribosylaminoimidazole-succinocarboxamide synthase